jgi:hypothetical protein
VFAINFLQDARDVHNKNPRIFIRGKARGLCRKKLGNGGGSVNPAFHYFCQAQQIAFEVGDDWFRNSDNFFGRFLHKRPMALAKFSLCSHCSLFVYAVNI